MTTRPEDAPRVATAEDDDDLPNLPTDAIEVMPLAESRPAREQIAARARELWLAGSRDTLGNWLQAERELSAP